MSASESVPLAASNANVRADCSWVTISPAAASAVLNMALARVTDLDAYSAAVNSVSRSVARISPAGSSLAELIRLSVLSRVVFCVIAWLSSEIRRRARS